MHTQTTLSSALPVLNTDTKMLPGQQRSLLPGQPGSAKPAHAQAPRQRHERMPSRHTRRGLHGASAATDAASSSSLIPDTLQHMDSDAEFQATLAAIKSKGQAQLTREEARARKRSLQHLNLPDFANKLQETSQGPLRRGPTTILQLNVGLYCNQACSHCHVESSPLRTEMMDRATADRCLQLLADSEDVTCLDITGGAPELNSHFRHVVTEARAQCGPVDIIDRCNLTVLCEPGQEDTADFLAQHKVHVIASLPCYSADNVEKQRGRGVFARSIEGLQKLNALGYGKAGTGLKLDLVYNPGGPFLAPAQAQLEPAYKQELREAYGIEFNSLLCLNNMPIKRYADWLLRNDKLSEYMELLVNSFNPASVQNLMCTNTLSVAWDGRIYDCDFNQQLQMTMAAAADDDAAAGSGSAAEVHGSSRSPPPAQQQQQEESESEAWRGLTVWDIDSLDDLTGRLVRVGSHCYGCTAGSGSGCQGATV